MTKAPGKSSEHSGTQILLDAMSKDKVHLARFVLDALDGGIVDSRTEGSRTPLISSILLPDGRTRCKFAELLLQRGANVNSPDGSGRTALSHACEGGDLEAVKVLVRNNADPEIVDAWGNTALMYAAVAGHCRVVEFLVRAFKRLGLRIDRQNKAGNSAAGVAEFLGHTECVDALTHSSTRGRAAAGDARPWARRGDAFEGKVGHLVDKLQLLRAYDGAETPDRRLPSMDSIEEFDKESEESFSPPRDLVFSGVLTPRPPPRPEPQPRKPGEKPAAGEERLPSLVRGCEAPKPRAAAAAATPTPSTLGILLTPNLVKKSDSRTLDFGARRFQDSYYQKRSSLPSSVLRPAPPERALLPLRKSKPTRRVAASPPAAGPPHFASSAPSAALSVLGSKLLRRFTAPEFRKEPRGAEGGPGPGPGPGPAGGVIPRSETFPQALRHAQVGSKHSVDSISSVRCEFDFHLRAPDPEPQDSAARKRQDSE